MATKQRKTTQKTEDISSGIPAGTQKLDDRTLIDDVRDKKRKKEQIPKGFTRRLPAGVKRTLKVNRDDLYEDKKNAKPFLVYENGKQVAKADKIRIEGDSDMVTKDIGGGGCGPSVSAHIETESSILIGKE